jgi:hypothetical protein
VETSRKNREENTPSKQKKEPTGVWKRKNEHEKQNKEESMFVQTALHAQNKGNIWYVDNVIKYTLSHYCFVIVDSKYG